MLVKDAKKLANISTGNSKMPGTTFAIDAFACKTGSKLAKIPGTPCHVCYARKLQKLRPTVDMGWKANLAKWESVESDPGQWVQSVAFQILRYNVDGFHRWFDSGDLQSLEMLIAIVEVCKLTPHIKHWLPTQEREILAAYEKNHTLPENLVVRVSASKINGKPPRAANTSNVVTDFSNWMDICRAETRNNTCGHCRKCWDKNVSNISYPKH